jgi:hypothetical protein
VFYIKANVGQNEIGSAAVVDPDSLTVEVPGRSLNTRRSAALIQHLCALIGIHVAIMTLAIF